MHPVGLASSASLQVFSLAACQSLSRCYKASTSRFLECVLGATQGDWAPRSPGSIAQEGLGEVGGPTSAEVLMDAPWFAPPSHPAVALWIATS